MARRYWILAALCLSACRTPRWDVNLLLPVSVAVTWRRETLRSLPLRAGVDRAFAAAYDGAGNLTVSLYETKISGTAFEMTQHWREAPNSVFFDQGRYFVVLQWERADRQALTRFIRELQTHLAAMR